MCIDYRFLQKLDFLWDKPVLFFEGIELIIVVTDLYKIWWQIVFE